MDPLQLKQAVYYVLTGFVYLTKQKQYNKMGKN